MVRPSSETSYSQYWRSGKSCICHVGYYRYLIPLYGGVFNPRAVYPDQRVGSFQKLSYDGKDGELCGFFGGAQVFVLGDEMRITPHGDESEHLGRVAQRLAPAPRIA